MGFLSRLFGADRPPGRFRTEAQYKKNRASQVARSTRLVEELRQSGGLGETESRLEFFFRTGRRASARKLAQALKTRSYEAEVLAQDDGTWAVSGLSLPLRTSSDVLLGWTEDMCRFGYEHDSEFGSWQLP